MEWLLVAQSGRCNRFVYLRFRIGLIMCP